jgi:hypothetical protein
MGRVVELPDVHDIVLVLENRGLIAVDVEVVRRAEDCNDGGETCSERTPLSEPPPTDCTKSPSGMQGDCHYCQPSRQEYLSAKRLLSHPELYQGCAMHRCYTNARGGAEGIPVAAFFLYMR